MIRVLKKENLKFNSINEIDYSGLNKLNTSLYGNYPDLKSELKLKTTYAPNQDLGIIVKNKEGSLISSYLVFPLLINYYGKPLWICQAGNTMLDHKYIGRNIIVDSALKLYDILIKMKYKAIIGIPSKSILRTRTKLLNWKKNSIILSYNFFIPTLPVFIFSRKFISIELFHKFYTKVLARIFFKRGDYFPSSDKFLENNNIFIERSNKYWEYKLKNSDILLLKSGKTNFVIKISRELYLGDIDIRFGLPNVLFRLKFFLFLILSFNASCRFFCTDNSFLTTFFNKLKKPKSSLNFCSRSFDSNLDFKNFSYTYFDFDTF